MPESSAENHSRPSCVISRELCRLPSRTHPAFESTHFPVFNNCGSPGSASERDYYPRLITVLNCFAFISRPMLRAPLLRSPTSPKTLPKQEDVSGDRKNLEAAVPDVEMSWDRLQRCNHDATVYQILGSVMQ